MHGGPRSEPRNGGTGRGSVHRLGCLEWFIPLQVNSFHPASPDGAPGKAAAPVRRFRFQAGVQASGPRNREKERAHGVSCHILNVPLERTSEGDHTPPFP